MSANNGKTSVTRKYGIKRLMNDMKYVERLAKRDELVKAWEVSQSRYYDIINAFVNSNISISAEQLVKAQKVLGCSQEDIMTPYEES